MHFEADDRAAHLIGRAIEQLAMRDVSLFLCHVQSRKTAAGGRSVPARLPGNRFPPGGGQVATGPRCPRSSRPSSRASEHSRGRRPHRPAVRRRSVRAAALRRTGRRERSNSRTKPCIAERWRRVWASWPRSETRRAAARRVDRARRRSRPTAGGSVRPKRHRLRATRSRASKISPGRRSSVRALCRGNGRHGLTVSTCMSASPVMSRVPGNVSVDGFAGLAAGSSARTCARPAATIRAEHASQRACRRPSRRWAGMCWFTVFWSDANWKKGTFWFSSKSRMSPFSLRLEQGVLRIAVATGDRPTGREPRSGLSVLRRLPGISEVGDKVRDSISALRMWTDLVESSGSVSSVIDSPVSSITRPMNCWPDSV